MTADVSQQEHASYELIRSLARLPTSDLVRFTLQKPDITRIFASSLNSLAIQAASSPLPAISDAPSGQHHVDILVRLMERGDPSLVRKFVPTQGSLVDLAVAAPSSAKAAIISILERLIDTSSVKDVLAGLSAQLKGVTSPKQQQDAGVLSAVIRTIARLSSAFLSVCPARALKANSDILTKWSQVCFQIYDRLLPQLAKDLENGDAGSTGPDVSKVDAHSWQLHWMTARVDLLQLIAMLLQHLKGSTNFTAATREGFVDTETLLQRGGFSTLLNSTALLDLAATSDTWPSLRSAIQSDVSLHKRNGDATLSSIDTLATTTPKFTGPAWAALQEFAMSQKPVQSEDTPQHSSPSTLSISEELLASVDSVLPHYGVDRLRVILSRPSFAGQSAEMVIQRLLEGDEGETATPAAAPPQAPASKSRALTPPPAVTTRSSGPAAPSLVKSRANLFGDFGFDPSTIVQPKQKTSSRMDELAPELKAAILARAEAADEDEGEEWNPFAEVHRTVGVEDELDLDYDGRERGSAPRRTAHEDDDGDDEDHEGDAARMRERALLRHYVQYGSTNFSADPGTRRSEARKKLKDQTGMSDDLIESWAVMLDRNPKKDRLLAAASQSELDEQMASRNSRNTSDVDDDEPSGGARSWGPDRGRGGRILGGGRGGRGGGGHRGGSNNAGGRGGHQTKNATRGRGTGNSSTDRSAKQKEKAGNKARQKGHDKKTARVNM